MAGGTFDLHLDELARALAVFHHEVSKIEQQTVERCPEWFQALVARFLDRGRAACCGSTRGEQHERVGGRRVAVDGDRVFCGLVDLVRVREFFGCEEGADAAEGDSAFCGPEVYEGVKGIFTATTGG